MSQNSICLYIEILETSLLSNINNLFAQWSGFKYFNWTLIILFHPIYLNTVKWFQILQCNTDNSIFAHKVFQVLVFKTCLFNIFICLHTVKCSNNSIWPIDGTLSGSTTPGQSRHGSNVYEEVLYILKSSWFRASPSDCLVSYPGHLLRGLLTLCRDAIGIFYSPSQLGIYLKNSWIFNCLLRIIISFLKPFNCVENVYIWSTLCITRFLVLRIKT